MSHAGWISVTVDRSRAILGASLGVRSHLGCDEFGDTERNDSPELSSRRPVAIEPFPERDGHAPSSIPQLVSGR